MTMDKPRIDVALPEFQTAVAVWLRTCPRFIWERYVRFEKKQLEKRSTEADQIDPRDELAKHIAAKMAQAGWTVTRPETGNFFENVASGPPTR